MSLEQAIRDVLDQKMNDGTVERLVAEHLEKAVNGALESLTGRFGDVTKVVEGKIKEVLLNQLENYNYSNYVVKLDSVLTEILRNTALDHKQLLENFKELMVNVDIPKKVKLSEIFFAFKEHVEKDINRSKLQVDDNDSRFYEDVTVTMEVERLEKRSWSCFEDAKIVFECSKDEDLNFELRLNKFEDYPWRLSVELDSSIKSLRYLNKFKIYLLKLLQAGPDIEIDTEFEERELELEVGEECL